MAGERRVGVTKGMRGYFAVLYDDDGPIQTAPSSWAKPEHAWDDASDWARSEGIPCDDRHDKEPVRPKR